MKAKRPFWVRVKGFVLRRMGAVEIGKDGLCKCTVADPCPLGRVGHTPRCSAIELLRAGRIVYMPQNAKVDAPNGATAE